MATFEIRTAYLNLLGYVQIEICLIKNEKTYKMERCNVLIVHDSELLRSSLASVLRLIGAHVVTTAGNAVEGSSLHFDPATDVLMLSHSLRQKNAFSLLDGATSQGVGVVVAHPAHADVPFPFSDYRCLIVPCIREAAHRAICDVLDNNRGCFHWSAGQRRH